MPNCEHHCTLARSSPSPQLFRYKLFKSIIKRPPLSTSLYPFYQPPCFTLFSPLLPAREALKLRLRIKIHPTRFSPISVFPTGSVLGFIPPPAPLSRPSPSCLIGFETIISRPAPLFPPLLNLPDQVPYLTIMKAVLVEYV